MGTATRPFRFGWWNLHNFAHFDPDRVAERGRWPNTQQEYDEKLGRVRAALSEAFGEALPDLLAVCEITRPAAEALRSRLPAGYAMTFAPDDSPDPFQVCVFYRPDRGLTAEPPLLPADLGDVTARTRPMLVTHLTFPGHVIRLVACHWTGMDEDSSLLARERLAEILRRDCYEFLHPEVPKRGQERHVVLFGDLNEEPMAEVFKERLMGCRDHATSQQTRDSYARQLRRVRLYNAAWRFLGEQTPHAGGPPPSRVIAGTYFAAPHGWRTFDHVLVSRGLLGASPPHLDESRTRILSADILVDDHGRPTPFVVGATRGVSDHLPLLGHLVLPEDNP
jgi:endonuclease/exonuclease/phosphatase family metal-dependent hydrolase